VRGSTRLARKQKRTVRTVLEINNISLLLQEYTRVGVTTMLKRAVKQSSVTTKYDNNVISLPYKNPIARKSGSKPTKANEALHPIIVSEEIFCSSTLRTRAYYSDDSTIVFNMDVNGASELRALHKMIVNCVVTSPPFYGQRDYDVEGQIGLEDHPGEFVRKLAESFDRCRVIGTVL
jgi:hypothetical protein